MKLSNMGSVLRAAGLTVVETAGWANRGYAGQDLVEVRGVLWHHTATHRSRFNEDAPTLSMCVNGRSDLPGPLCQIVLGRNGTVYLTAAGLANHAGQGNAAGIPTDAGNYYLIGIEMESSGIAPWDWTADQLRVAPYLGAALEKGYLSGLPADQRLQLGHKEYSSGGKIDPAGWPGDMDGLRTSINEVLAGTITAQSTTITPVKTKRKEWDEMASKDEIAAVVAETLTKWMQSANGKKIIRNAIGQTADAAMVREVLATVQDIAKTSGTSVSAVDADAVVDAIADRLTAKEAQ
jgi:hypothetical protein